MEGDDRMQNIRNITDKILWVGASDRRLHLFENMFPIPDGVAYNSYVINDEKIAVMDTVDAAFGDEWLKNIADVLNGATPDYLIIQHMEPDHSANIQKFLEVYPNIKVVGNAKTFTMIGNFFRDLKLADENKLEVKNKDTLTLGKHELTFVFAPMVHWPEVMVTYESSEKILFSADGFGKFGALSLTENEDWACEARRYYFNIVGKYGIPVQTLLKKAAGLDIATICPLHGPILTENLGYYLDLYNTWSSYEPESKGILIAYASIHGNTGKAAEKLAEILRSKGAEKVVVSDLAREDMAEVIEDAFRYDRMIVAAASYDGGVFPCMQDFLHHLQSKAYQNRKVGIVENGSWGPTAARTMKAILEPMKNITIVDPVVTIKSTLKESDIPNLEALADAML